MPLAVEFQEPARFTIRASGEVTLSQIEAAYEEIISHPGLKTGSDIIVEADEVRSAPPSEELREAANLMVPMMERGLGALAIVSKNPFTYGVARVFSVFAETVGAKVGAFRKPEDASRWLAHRRLKVSSD